MGLWVIVGASRGIGLEFVRQLVERDDHVIATVRGDFSKASQLWACAGASDIGSCRLLECDVKLPESIDKFAQDLSVMAGIRNQIDCVVVNAGILNYPNVS
ncbi:MAG: hypothetical protein LQ351_001719 [Letrouitia transgressa]|nr:MAG: hypothetical protein LQ351_001719 [Letrouitia transgressa]